MRARWAVLALVLAACGDGTSDDTDPLCVDAPLVTWVTFGQDFTRENCQSCHASTSADRNGAPESIVFDNEEQVLELADRILERAAAEPPTMPPRGGLELDDQERLRIWLSCD